MEKIQIQLSPEEALVLFDFLSRFSVEDRLEIADHAENVVLWGALCQLEKVLVEPSMADYSKFLEAARQNVRGEG